MRYAIKNVDEYLRQWSRSKNEILWTHSFSSAWNVSDVPAVEFGVVKSFFPAARLVGINEIELVHLFDKYGRLVMVHA